MAWVCVLALALPVSFLAAPAGPASLRAPAEEEHHPQETPTHSTASLEQRRPSVRHEPVLRRPAGEASPRSIGRSIVSIPNGHRYLNGLLAPLRC